MKPIKLIPFLLFLSLGFGSQAQELTIGLQVRPRFEFRNGYKNLRDEAAEPASFISQRSRLGLSYTEDKLRVHLSLQNVITWGDKLPGSVSDRNSTGLYEAYASFQFTDFIGVKAGRQVLSYDNERIFGEGNWTQAARTHDAFLIKISPDDRQQVDIGIAFNSDEEGLKKFPYTTKNYKSLEYAWYHADLAPLSLSLLFLNAGYERVELDGGLKNDYQQTFGGFIKFIESEFRADAAFYSQMGKREGQSLDAWYASSNVNYMVTSNLSAGLGFEYLSGSSQTRTSEANRSFIPLFGTNHAFNGAMDYFYVGNHQNSVGLKDFYGKLEYTQPKYSVQIKPHVFYAAESVLSSDANIAMDDYLATEIDISASYKVQKNLTVNLGYSQVFGTNSLEQLRGGDSSLSQNWAWLSLTFNPSFKILSK